MAHSIPIRNASKADLRIMIEPVAGEYDVAPGEAVELRGDLAGLAIDFGDDNFLALWVPGEAVVFRDGERLRPLMD